MRTEKHMETMQKREDGTYFHIGSVISAHSGRLLTLNHIEGIYEILGFLTGDDDIMTHQLPDAAHQNEAWLAEQFPWLVTEHEEYVKFGNSLKGKTEGVIEQAIRDFLSKKAEQHGEFLKVERPENPKRIPFITEQLRNRNIIIVDAE